ncbi:Leucine-responsive regulatory protein [Kocuria rosea]|nr:Leucine-responsive regulatory protein [Kocuria rosea]
MDVRLATEVSHDPRATLAQLSERVGLSVSAVQARLRKLESSGVIAGYQAILDPEAIGKPLAAFIEITPLDPRQPDNAPELLQSITAIEACHSVAGDSAEGARGPRQRGAPRGLREHPHHRGAANLLRAPADALPCRGLTQLSEVPPVPGVVPKSVTTTRCMYLQ